MKSKFEIEAEELSGQERARLAEALGGLAEGDVPLLIELLFVDEEEIRTLNRTYRDTDKVTDVLSFPALEDVKGKPILAARYRGELDEEGRLILGSVAICRKRAEEQAEEYGHSREREICYLAVHGVLHCLGYDHETEEEKSEMREKEEEVMRRLGLGRAS